MGNSGLGCGSKMAKYFLFLFNIVFWLIGAVVLGVGIWVLVDKRALNLLEVATVDSGNDALVKGAGITFIIVGVIVFITGFLGCWGALKENACMLLTYAIIVGVILFLQFVAGILGAVFKDKILGQLGQSMTDTVQTKYLPLNEEGQYRNPISQSFDFVQKEFKCCGAINGTSDWASSKWKTQLPANNTQVVPDACCPLVDKNALIPEPTNRTACQKAALDTNTPDRESFVWTKGCKPALEDWVKNHAGILIGVAFGLAAIQAFGVLLACCLRNAIRKGYEYV